MANPHHGRCNHGSYTGDDQADQAITGVGFEWSILEISERETTTDTSVDSWRTTAEILDDDGSGGCFETLGVTSHKFVTGLIKSREADGFTVGGVCNTDGKVYNWIAQG